MKVPILIPKLFDYPFTYNSGSMSSLKPGDFVIVPFGTQKEVGIVWNKIQPLKKKIKLKNIEKKINNFSININLIKYINWFSMYNLVSKGKILKMCIGNKDNILKIEGYKNRKLSLGRKIFKLSKEQKNSLNKLLQHNKKFNVSVLQGVTGSGKTIIYFEVIKKILKKNQQVLILLPEIFLTRQFEERFIEYFNVKPAIWHSKITPKNKREIWQGIINNKIKIVIGVRSSLFLPFKDLGIIIVDEEHDPSYKQDEGLTYHARDMAISRAFFENIPINLVTSVPSLETFKNIKNKKYNLSKINNRFKLYPLPKTKIIDLKISALSKDEHIADQTIDLVKKFLNKNDQVLFFLNRRGYAPLLICKNCGFKHACPNCSLYLTYHKSKDRLICHQCGLKIKKEKKCIKKDFCNFKMYGPGVEKVFEELKKKFPQKKIKIFSSDFLNKKKENENLLKEIKENKINILVGTQMISKGFNFPKLNCIVVVDADFSGKGYDLRTTEKNIQLYNQLSGRAGRFSNNSLIIYQTIFPLDETLKDILANDPEKFLSNELKIRKKNKLPPFYRLIALIISSNFENDSLRGAQEIKRKLLKIDNFEVLGPVSSPVFKVKNKYRTRLLIRCNYDNLIQKKVGKILENLKISKRIKLTVDVDPINFN
tara:strand:- start:183 stop:2138 length:1956 start_codon:yes stop_codon:yes gene_type:complete